MRVRDQLAWNRINSSYVWFTMYESLKWSTLMASFGHKNIYISIIFQNYYIRPEEVLLPGLWLMILSWNCIIRMNSSGHQEKKIFAMCLLSIGWHLIFTHWVFKNLDLKCITHVFSKHLQKKVFKRKSGMQEVEIATVNNNCTHGLVVIHWLYPRHTL